MKVACPHCDGKYIDCQYQQINGGDMKLKDLLSKGGCVKEVSVKCPCCESEFSVAMYDISKVSIQQRLKDEIIKKRVTIDKLTDEVNILEKTIELMGEP